MKKTLMYSTGQLFTEAQTGGTKRFIELCSFLQKNAAAELCCQDEPAVLRQKGLNPGFQIQEPPEGSFRFLPPEAALLIYNRKLIKKLRRENYDCLVSFDVPPSIGLCLCGFKNLVLLIRKDLIGYENVKGSSGFRHKIKNALLWLSEDICLKKAKTVITQCRYDKNQLIQRHKRLSCTLEDKIRIQINNVNPSWIMEKSAAAAGRTPPDGRFTVCFTGNFNDPRKGHGILLEAAELIHAQGLPVYFEIVGAGRDFEKYKNRYQSEYITFRGRLDNPIELLKSSQLCVVPSLADSCPNTVMESLYNGVPVIGSRAGGIPEILLNDAALFELSAEALAAKITELYTDPSALAELNAKEAVRKKELQFDWAEKIARTAQII